MRLKECSFLADENIHPALTAYLKQNGYNISTAAELNLTGKPDLHIIKEAYKSGRIILTHDSDFGTLAVASRQSFNGIVYIRPGHINGEYVIETIKSLFEQDIDIIPGTIIIVRREDNYLKIRVRRQGI